MDLSALRSLGRTIERTGLVQLDGATKEDRTRERIVIFIGLDDTDTLETQGTNQLARMLLQRICGDSQECVIVRHQLFFDPRVPYI